MVASSDHLPDGKNNILKKAFSGRFGFGGVELRKLLSSSQKQSNGKCLMKV
ncbi:MAG: hypothetical protein KBT32_04450 [Bacteroidales bacterium]|nr:hypothetical protein [Candidatus Physcocola equi]